MPEKNKTAVPRLRFPEFRDAGPWEVKRLGEVASEFRDGDWIEAKDQSPSGIRLIQTGNIGVGVFLDNADRSRFVSEETFRRLRCAEVFPGDLLVSRLPDPAGRCCLIPDIGARMITAVDCTIVRFDNRNISPYFYLSYCQTDKYFHEVATRCSGSTRQRISRQELAQVFVPLPSFPEQQKIADCLSSLDDLIRAEAARLEALQAHKKGLMQQLFPREGETTPHLRFPEFRDAGPWEVKRLGDICEINNGSSNAQDHVDTGEYPLFDRSLTVKRSNTYLFDCEAVIIPGEGSEFPPRYYKGKFDLHQRAYALTQFNAEGKFVFFLMDRWKAQLAEQAVKSTVLSLRMPILENFRITIPSKPEQQKIADCLSSLDDLIRAGAAWLEALQAHKKGLMQQLFPQEVS